MKRIQLTRVSHKYKRGDKPERMSPTITRSGLLYDDDEPIGFYLAELPERLKKIAEVIDAEFQDERVPKTVMKRAVPDLSSPGKKNQYYYVKQKSCILGSIAAKAHMRRNYMTRSSVHSVNSANNFVKAMMLMGRASLELIRELAPGLYDCHQRAVLDSVPEKWRFAGSFTSTISNSNISVDIHQDNLNVKNALNVILIKRRNAKGGHLFVPDYNAVFESPDNSMIVYPAWRNLHGVTPIEPTHRGGYRDSHIWYALKGFKEDSNVSK
tara:strand:+ start:874 stop:1677 length:804 start_codon:yes stop_codon:yes gene_type:complete